MVQHCLLGWAIVQLVSAASVWSALLLMWAAASCQCSVLNINEMPTCVSAEDVHFHWTSPLSASVLIRLEPLLLPSVQTSFVDDPKCCVFCQNAPILHFWAVTFYCPQLWRTEKCRPPQTHCLNLRVAYMRVVSNKNQCIIPVSYTHLTLPTKRIV